MMVWNAKSSLILPSFLARCTMAPAHTSVSQYLGCCVVRVVIRYSVRCSYRLVSCHSIIAILEFYNFYNFTKSIDLNMFSMFDLNSSPDIDASRQNKTQRYSISIVSTIYLHTNIYNNAAGTMR